MRDIKLAQTQLIHLNFVPQKGATIFVRPKTFHFFVLIFLKFEFAFAANDLDALLYYLFYSPFEEHKLKLRLFLSSLLTHFFEELTKRVPVPSAKQLAIKTYVYCAFLISFPIGAVVVNSATRSLQ